MLCVRSKVTQHPSVHEYLTLLSREIILGRGQIVVLYRGLYQLTCQDTHQYREYARRISQGASRTAQHNTRVVNIFQDIVAKNYIKRPGVAQVCELGGIAVFQRNPLRNSSFPHGTLREIQHWYRGIQQRDVKTKSRQAHRDGAGTAPKI